MAYRAEMASASIPLTATLTAYISCLVAGLASRDDLGHPAVATANTHLWLTSSVTAPSRGVAVDKVKQAFDEVLEMLGSGKLPDGGHPSWSAYTLEAEPTLVWELAAA